MSTFYERRRMFTRCVTPVLQRDTRTCRYCGEPAAHVDQYAAGDPTPDTLAASCLACHIVGKGKTFATIDEKRDWIARRRDETVTREDVAPESSSLHPWRRKGYFASTRSRQP